MRKSFSLMVLFLVLMVLASGCTLFAPKNVKSSITLVLKDGTPLSSVVVDLVKSGKKLYSATTNKDGTINFVLKQGNYKVQASIELGSGGVAAIDKDIAIKKDQEDFEIKVDNVSRLDVNIKDVEEKLIPDSVVQIYDANDILINEVNAKTGDQTLFVTAGKTYKVGARVGEFSSDKIESVAATENVIPLSFSIKVRTFSGTLVSNGDVVLSGVNVAVGKFNGTTDATGKFAFAMDKEISNVVITMGDYIQTIENVDVTKPQTFTLNVGLVDTVIMASAITFEKDETKITLVPNASGEVKGIIPNDTYKVTIDLPYYQHTMASVEVAGNCLNIGRTFKTIEEFGVVRVGGYTAENGVFTPNKPGNQYAILRSHDKYADATFYVEVTALKWRFMLQMRNQDNTAPVWTSAYSLDVTMPQAGFMALRKYIESSSPNPDLRSGELNPTTYVAGDQVAVILKAYGEDFSVDLIKKEDESLAWHEAYKASDYSDGYLTICSWATEPEFNSFINPTVLF